MAILKNSVLRGARLHAGRRALKKCRAAQGAACRRVVIVTPSVYGTDNSSSLFGIKARGATARGVAVIDDRTTEAQLDTMQADGFRGMRINLATDGVNDAKAGRMRFTAAIERMTARGWHVQLYTTLAMISAIRDLVLAAPVPAGSTIRRPGRFARAGAAWIAT